MKRILVVALVSLSLVMVACSETGNTLPPLVVKATQPQVEATPMAETTTLAVSMTVASTTPMTTTQPSTAQPGEKPDWGWNRALQAARGQHDFVRNASLGACQKLASQVKDCVFFKWEDQTAEFGFNGVDTYFVVYNRVGGGKEFGLWRTVTTQILFPLTSCPGQTYGGAQVAVKFLSPSGLVDFCTQTP